MKHCRGLLPVLFLSVCLAQVRDPLPVPDVAGYRTLKCDFHMHTVFSDGQVWPNVRAAEAWRDGLDAIAITDHANGGNRDVLKPDLTLGFALARPQADQFGILLIPGVEVAQGQFHCNGLFAENPNELARLDLMTALRKLRAQDAFVFWNHPGWQEKARWFPEIAAPHQEGLIQGMELVNGLTFYPEAYPFVEEKKLTIFANSDIHAPMPPQNDERKRPVTLVFARTADAAGVREALDARRTAAWMGGEVWGAEHLLAGLWQGAVKVEPSQFEIRPERRRIGLRFHNTSAIPFRFRLKESPPWLTLGGVEVPAQKLSLATLSAGKNAPVGDHDVELELEVTNLHTGPGNNLVVRLPLRVGVAK